MAEPKKCQRAFCGSDRILTIHARAKDMHTFEIHGEVQDGHYGGVLSDDGDSTDVTFCLSCGQIQAEFPFPPMFMEPDYFDPESEVEYVPDVD